MRLLDRLRSYARSLRSTAQPLVPRPLQRAARRIGGTMAQDKHVLRIEGFCPICRQETTFVSSDPWLRDHLNCVKCPDGSIPRERALALILNEERPGWRELAIHESSPSPRGISALLAKEAKSYTPTQYFPDQPTGAIVCGIRNEDLEDQSFGDETFDIVVSLDVMEHVYNPDLAFAEIYRTLKPGGVYLCTFPVRKDQVEGWQRRFTRNDDGSVEHHKPPEIHGNPIDDGGSIVAVDYGYDLHQSIASWAPFDVRVMRFADARHGILGEYTEVVVCRKGR